jgi:FAD/FMN-containing dehydrogenase
MDIAALKTTPAWAALEPAEREEASQRLGAWSLDTALVAASAGEEAELEVEDLRFWLRSTAHRPWELLRMAPDAALVDLLFRDMLARGPELESHPQRTEVVGRVRSFCRSAVSCASLRPAREEHLAALSAAIDQLGDWEREDLLDLLGLHGLGTLAQGIQDWLSDHRGLHGLLDRLRDRLSTAALDLRHGGLFISAGHPDHEGRYREGRWSNWTDNYSARPRRYALPRSEEQLSELARSTPSLRVVGGGHSFNDSPLCDETMVSLDAMDEVLAVDLPARRVRVQAGIRLRDLNRYLQSQGLALPMLGSTDAQSIGGLIATDLHGSGRDHGFLSEQVRGLRVMDAQGRARELRPGEPWFHAVFGAIGTCGIVTEVELELVPSFSLRKSTRMVDRAQAEEQLSESLEACDHLSYYYVGGAEDCEAVREHRWEHVADPPDADWETRKLQAELKDFAISAAVPGLAELLSEMDENAWLSNGLAPDERLTMPASAGFGRKLFYRHDEIELAVPFDRWRSALSEVMDLLAQRNFFSIVELRFTPDRSCSLIGPGAGQRSAWIELATPLSQERGEIYFLVEQILRRHGGRPHLGKKTSLTAGDLFALHGERFALFQQVRELADPQGRFLNNFSRRLLYAPGL